MSMKMDLPELPEPMDSTAASEVLNEKDGDEIDEDDERMSLRNKASCSANSCSTASCAGASWRFLKAAAGCSERRAARS